MIKHNEVKRGSDIVFISSSVIIQLFHDNIEGKMLLLFIRAAEGVDLSDLLNYRVPEYVYRQDGHSLFPASTRPPGDNIRDYEIQTIYNVNLTNSGIVEHGFCPANNYNCNDSAFQSQTSRFIEVSASAPGARHPVTGLWSSQGHAECQVDGGKGQGQNQECDRGRNDKESVLYDCEDATITNEGKRIEMNNEVNNESTLTEEEKGRTMEKTFESFGVRTNEDHSKTMTKSHGPKVDRKFMLESLKIGNDLHAKVSNVGKIRVPPILESSYAKDLNGFREKKNHDPNSHHSKLHDDDLGDNCSIPKGPNAYGQKARGIGSGESPRGQRGQPDPFESKSTILARKLQSEYDESNRSLRKYVSIKDGPIFPPSKNTIPHAKPLKLFSEYR